MEHEQSKQSVKRYAYQGVVFGILMFTWMVFSGLFDAFHLTLGVISCGFVTWISSDFLFEDRQSPASRLFRQTIRMMTYFCWLLWQVVLANFHLLRLAFSSESAMQSQIIRYESKLQSDYEKYMLANSITLTPGTVTIKIVGNTFYIHAISDMAAEDLDGEMERRIAHIFADQPAPEPST